MFTTRVFVTCFVVVVSLIQGTAYAQSTSEFVFAAHAGNLAKVQELIREGVDVNAESYGLTALEQASKWGNLAVVQALVAAGAQPDRERSPETALSLASEHGHLETVLALLAAGARVNNKNLVPERVQTYKDGPRIMYPPEGCTALIVASEGGNTAIVKALIGAHADVNAKCFYGETGLILASRAGALDTVEALIAAGADVKAAGGMDAADTAGMAAARRCHADVLKTLLAAGGEINMATGPYGTALTQASWSNCLDTVRILIAAGANVNDYHGSAYVQNPPLYAAARQGNLEIVRILLAAKADIEENDGGGTAVYGAAEAGHLDIVQELLAAGANVGAKTAAGETALVAAFRYHHQEVANLLKEASDIAGKKESKQEPQSTFGAIPRACPVTSSPRGDC